MNVSSLGKSFIQSFEKCRLMPYQDQGGKWTIGYGHLVLADEDFTNGITQDQADSLFATDLAAKAEQPVSEAVSVDLNQQQFDALCSLCYNIGAGNFHGSTLVKLLNENMPPDRVAAEFGKWCHVNGEVSEGLFERRGAEADIFLDGKYVDHS